jgi:hypothetical protein
MFTQPGTVPVSEKLSPAAQSAQTAINEANILLTAAANVIAQNVVDGISTKDEGQKQIDQVRTYATQVDRAQKLLESGDIVSARNQAEPRLQKRSHAVPPSRRFLRERQK